MIQLKEHKLIKSTFQKQEKLLSKLNDLITKL